MTRALCLLILFLGLTGAVRAETKHEFWPEFDYYRSLGDRSRLFALAGITQMDNGSGRATYRAPPADAIVGIHLDYSLSPPLRKHLVDQHWERNRYFWTRVGYQYSKSLHDSDPHNSWRENRGVFELNVRTPPLLGGLEWVARTRWDLRSRNSVNSSLYRARIGVERQMSIAGYVSVPYADAEAIYDTRYKLWKQSRYRIGIEVTLSPHWRLDPGLTLQLDDLASPRRLLAFGLGVKYFH